MIFFTSAAHSSNILCDKPTIFSTDLKNQTREYELLIFSGRVRYCFESGRSLPNFKMRFFIALRQHINKCSNFMGLHDSQRRPSNFTSRSLSRWRI
uniref:Uncharacterized protein n=1 Tax=Arundo donax TaxID=35708 RepID=A0A0A9CM45_ARUDO